MPRLAATVGDTLAIDPLFLPAAKVVSPRSGNSLANTIMKHSKSHLPEGLGWEGCKQEALYRDNCQVLKSSNNTSAFLDKVDLISTDEDAHSVNTSRNGLSIESDQSSSSFHASATLPHRGVYPTKVAYNTISCSENPDDVLDVFSIGLENGQGDVGASSTAVNQHQHSGELPPDGTAPITSDDCRVPLIPQCNGLLKFLQTYHSLIHCLIRVSRKSAFVSKNPDIRFVALSIMQQYLTSGNHHPRIGGIRNQGVLIATCLLLGGKYCDQDTFIPNIISETELDKTATVNVADVMEMEITVLKAIDFQISVPLVWEAITHLAIKMDSPTGSSIPKIGECHGYYRQQYEQYTPAIRQRVIFAGLYADRVLYELGRNDKLAEEVVMSGADELALGASIATAAGLSIPVTSVMLMFQPFFLMFGASSNVYIPADVANLYADCLTSLGGVISKFLNHRRSNRQRARHHTDSLL